MMTKEFVHFIQMVDTLGSDCERKTERLKLLDDQLTRLTLEDGNALPEDKMEYCAIASELKCIIMQLNEIPDKVRLNIPTEIEAEPSVGAAIRELFMKQKIAIQRAAIVSNMLSCIDYADDAVGYAIEASYLFQVFPKAMNNSDDIHPGWIAEETNDQNPQDMDESDIDSIMNSDEESDDVNHPEQRFFATPYTEFHGSIPNSLERPLLPDGFRWDEPDDSIPVPVDYEPVIPDGEPIYFKDSYPTITDMFKRAPRVDGVFYQAFFNGPESTPAYFYYSKYDRMFVESKYAKDRFCKA